ncbi:DUF2256 domain-containing protein [Flavobacterium sp.]|uniref:DUF2256 domain-containing protein n=1 Tax=Flavobacterium sp. TaxID=239 RepID=UPI002636B084|nr:DUF2256 domain-containing protein [Flavobacterium sp.]MDD2987224.1 DUF2256 domain-containing protein [Flavobacterium sp.]
MAHKKVNLPEKICLVCKLPFSWRKKWEKNWEEVKYCSDKCRLNRNCNNKITNSNKNE